MQKLCQKVSEQCREMDRGDIACFLGSITKAKRIFIGGVGRSGLVASTFGMRLMHLGFTVYVVGEVVTPAIRKGDLLVLVSGSGKTASIVGAMKTAKAKGARVAAITSFPDSPLGKGSDCVVRVKGRRVGRWDADYVNRQLAGRREPIAPLGTLFELATMVFLDSVVEELMLRYRKSEKELKELHTNLE